MFKSKIISKKEIARNVIKLRFEKPEDFEYTANQVITLGVSEDSRGMFSLISRPSENFLEVIIKIYPEHHGVTEKISFLKENDEVVFGNPFGGMKDNEDIFFIAGGTGITPFIAHLRNFENTKNYCLVSFLTRDDIIEEDFLKTKSFCRIFLTQEKTDKDIDKPEIDAENFSKYSYGYINKKEIEDILKIKSFNKAYVCGPPKFEEAMIEILKELNVEGLKIY